MLGVGNVVADALFMVALEDNQPDVIAAVEGVVTNHHSLRQGRSVPYARTQVLPHRFDNLKKN